MKAASISVDDVRGFGEHAAVLLRLLGIEDMKSRSSFGRRGRAARAGVRQDSGMAACGGTKQAGERKLELGAQERYAQGDGRHQGLR